ncbi:MAG: carbohydrate kinase family protein [Parcubacteria group bacterium]|nr:carbohydrate kinase family protein [Parcubacteria group bacterium]
MNNYDFLGIGDTVIDAFIKIKEARVFRDHNGEKPQLCLNFADKIPYEDVHVVPAVGNSPNAAVAASRLGLKSALLTNIGDDLNGQDCLKALKAERVSVEYIAKNNGKKTNYHYVLWFEDDRTILVKHEAYDYKMPDIKCPRWVYLSSMGENSLPFHYELLKCFEEHPDIRLAFQPGTFQMKFGKKALAGIYKRSDVFFCNKEEAQRILETEEGDIKNLLKAMAGLGPKIVVITDGVKGAYSYDGHEMLSMRLYPDPVPPLERTGAGDAFSSTFTAALALGKTVREAMMWAPVNPMSVVQQIGARAGLLTREQIEEYLAKAPVDYIPKVLD